MKIDAKQNIHVDIDDSEQRHITLYKNSFWNRKPFYVALYPMVRLLKRKIKACGRRLGILSNRTCIHCKEPLVEYARNEYYVFYKCGCHLHKGVEWDWQDALVGGVQYSLGSAGSFIYVCPECNSTSMRQYLRPDEWCVRCCGTGKHVTMNPLSREMQDKEEEAYNESIA